MTVTVDRPTFAPGSARHREGGDRIVYAIAFDMDTRALQDAYGSSNWRTAYRDIRDFLAGHGFTPRQGSVYFGDDDVSPVTTVLAVQSLAREFTWFAASVRDIRMLRINEDNDLLPAIGAVTALPQALHAPKPDSLFDVFDMGEPLEE